jgi:hypothetical protein
MSGLIGRAVVAAALAGAALAERPATVVQAPDSPVRLDHAIVLTAADAPPILVYSATNTSDDNIDEYTVIAFVFDAQGTLKARQTAPARRTLDAHGTKYSTLVLDGSPIQPTDKIVAGVNAVQKVGSENWWHANLQEQAVAAVQPPQKH